MPNIVYFEIPADDVARATRFYQSLLGWEIEPAKDEHMDLEVLAEMQYQVITLGGPKEGNLSEGGLYRRQTSEPILNHVEVENINEVLGRVEELGGTIVMPKMKITGVGLNAIIRDTEGNTIGLLQPTME
jgi:predicted enzyme related to lactoylglutathione lyase